METVRTFSEDPKGPIYLCERRKLYSRLVHGGTNLSGHRLMISSGVYREIKVCVMKTEPSAVTKLPIAIALNSGLSMLAL
jgi:hypothetical protein